MFWNKKGSTEEEYDNELPYEDDELEESDIIENDEDASEEEDDENIKVAEISSVCCKAESLAQLARFANRRGNGTMQFMTKNTQEVFELRDAHFRIAQVWGTVTMARECTPDEYARVMLAIELRDDPDKFYMLPGLTESEIKNAIEDFCEDHFSLNGKKYSKKPERFTKLLKENDMREAWDDYTGALIYDKLEVFCEEHGITFSGSEEIKEEKSEDGSDA